MGNIWGNTGKYENVMMNICKKNMGMDQYLLIPFLGG
jgi:hypothetical protein